MIHHSEIHCLYLSGIRFYALKSIKHIFISSGSCHTKTATPRRFHRISNFISQMEMCLLHLTSLKFYKMQFLMVRCCEQTAQTTPLPMSKCQEILLFFLPKQPWDLLSISFTFNHTHLCKMAHREVIDQPVLIN